MKRYTAHDIVGAISLLPRNKDYGYINPHTPGKIRIDDVIMFSGPVHIRRWNPGKGQSYSLAKTESISAEMIGRVSNALYPGEPFNIDRILGASYNTRSVLETLIALTPEFYYCYPGRIKDVGGVSTVEHGHKHLIWLPDEPHAPGILAEKKVAGMEISEIPARSVMYEGLVMPENIFAGGMSDIETARRHTQIQIALYIIGYQLGFQTWIARNDRGINYKGKPFAEHPGIIAGLDSQNIISAFPGASEAANFIDCIWFDGCRFMPAVIEVEHTTGITSGLTRMKGLQDKIPAVKTRYVIAAPDSEREKVMREANREQFSSLDARYFSYSSIEELYYICVRRNLRGVTHEFLDCYMERVCTL